MTRNYLFSAKRKNDPPHPIEPVDGILVPSLILVIEDIVHLEPQVQLPQDPKLHSRIHIEPIRPGEGNPIRRPVGRPLKGKQVRRPAVIVRNVQRTI